MARLAWFDYWIRMATNAFKMLPFCKTICILLLISGSLAKSKEDEAKREIKEAKKTAKLPPCAACNALVSSFQAGMKRTARGKLEGGDTAWEEKNQVYTKIR